MHFAAGVDEEVPVVIVGYGPVGQALAGLLGRAGHEVVVFERFKDIYRMPRAVHLDHEIMRVLQSLGLAEVLAEEMVPVRDYQWYGADGELLWRIDRQDLARSGWENSYLFFQPQLEAAIHRDACVPADVTAERGWLAEGLEDRGDHVEVTLQRVSEEEPGQLTGTGEYRRVRARWLVGADGANSFVREACGITSRDLGFQERWLVVDAEPHDMAALAHLPIASQRCDPARPTTVVQSGPRHRRWEFMLLPHEQPSDFEDRDRVWALLEPWYRPEHGPLTRSTVYEFRSLVAEHMRKGRALIVGDAAHLTPPFLGQGLCSGVRDAVNLAWKLDLVLRELASERLLDTVERERQPQNEAIIRLAMELGRVLCELDPQAAAERDAMLRKAGPPPPVDPAPLTAGLLHQPIGEPDRLAGTLSVQGVVERAGREGRFDDVVGRGFQLIVVEGDPFERLSDRHRALLDALGATVASLDPAAPHGVRDCDGRLTAWLSEHNAHAVLVRPDFYVFGGAVSPQAVPDLLDDLRTQLQITPEPATSRALR